MEKFNANYNYISLYMIEGNQIISLFFVACRMTKLMQMSSYLQLNCN